MTETSTAPVVWVQVMQALIARELVEGFGLSERQTAVLLGIVPSSVSQYLSGKRLGPTLSKFLDDDLARGLARRTAEQLMSGATASRAVLEASIALGERAAPRGRTAARAPDAGLKPEVRRKIPGWLRDRIAGEQNAVAECMRLAQRSRDELTRALFRQIASDSLRHAEIVASLAAYLDRGVATSTPTGITRADVDDLIRREREAEETSEIDLGPELGGMMRILWESMESDERKHERLLELLLDAGLAERGTDRKTAPRASKTTARDRRP
ncbi:MAG TPA: hypothetical protein VMF04_05085 [Thermoplasmata archaeon]|nr:hypothetical protein [Thermoplasmata archaeon]